MTPIKSLFADYYLLILLQARSIRDWRISNVIFPITFSNNFLCCTWLANIIIQTFYHRIRGGLIEQTKQGCMTTAPKRWSGCVINLSEADTFFFF